MRIKGFSLALAFSIVASCAVAQTAATVIVASTPATTEAVQNSAFWSEIANIVIAGFGAIASAVVATLAKPAYQWLSNRSSLAAMFVTQAMVDKMVAGIQNIIRAQAANLEHRLGTDAPLTNDQKKQLAVSAQPKVEEAFKETLARVGKTPGSQAINDMILGHVDQALAKPTTVAVPAIPFPLSRG